MSKSIRYYFFTSIATVLVTSLLVLMLILSWLSLSYVRDQKQDLLEEVIKGITKGVSSGEITSDPLSLQSIDSMAGVAGANVFIADMQGRIVYVTDGFEDLVESDIQLAQNLVEAVTRQAMYSEQGTLGGLFARNHYIYASALAAPNGDAIGVVVASADASSMKGYVSDMISGFILSGGLVLLISSMVALALANRTVIPIRRVSDAARRFGEGDYSARVPVEGDDELAQLAVTFNEMASSCEATDSSRRSFMGNIAHELRTPMTSIKGFIDGMLDGTIPENQRDKYLGIVSEEVGRLARLTQNMLDISKLEAGEYTPKNSEFDIWGPVTTVLLSNERRLEEKHIDVVIDPEDAVVVKADEDFVHQVLFNILDNAIKFTEDGGTIRITVEPGKGSAAITVYNTGTGIPADVLPYIFERFYKGDKSRGLNAKGSGLGLHICKVLVNLMGGRIWAESEEGEWTGFHFTLPTVQKSWATGHWAEGRVKQTMNAEEDGGETEEE